MIVGSALYNTREICHRRHGQGSLSGLVGAGLAGDKIEAAPALAADPRAVGSAHCLHLQGSARHNQDPIDPHST